MAGDGGCSGSGGGADEEPVRGLLEVRQKTSAVRRGHGGVAFAKERGGARFFVGQILRERGVARIGRGAVLQVVVERDKVGLRNGNGRGRGFAGSAL